MSKRRSGRPFKNRLNRRVILPFPSARLSKTPAASIPPAELAHEVSVLSSWHETADQLTKTPVVQNFVATTSAVTTTSTGFVVSFALAAQPHTKAATLQLVRVLDRTPLVKRAEAEMRRLGLDKGTGTNRSPLEILGDAQQAFGGGPGPVLGTLRNAIEGTLAALLPRRPIQEPAGKAGEKVESIGRQCGRDGLPPNHFPDLGVSAKNAIDTLSGTKLANLPPEKVSALFYEGVTLLNSLLESLDEAKLEPRSR